MDEWLRLLDDARADERRRSRELERRLRTIDEEAATLAGTFVDLAERGVTVRLATTTGRSYVGRVRLAATDFVVVATPTGDVWVALAGLGSIRTNGGAAVASGDRCSVDLRLIEAVARIVADRPRLAFVVVGGERLAGELRAVGADVVTIRSDGDGTYAYLPSASILEIFRSG